MNEKGPVQADTHELALDQLRVLGDLFGCLDAAGCDPEDTQQLRLMLTARLRQQAGRPVPLPEEGDQALRIARPDEALLESLDTAALIARSSLGTPSARRVRSLTSASQIAEILRRRDQLATPGRAAADARTEADAALERAATTVSDAHGEAEQTIQAARNRSETSPSLQFQADERREQFDASVAAARLENQRKLTAHAIKNISELHRHVEELAAKDPVIAEQLHMIEQAMISGITELIHSYMTNTKVRPTSGDSDSEEPPREIQAKDQIHSARTDLTGRQVRSQ